MLEPLFCGWFYPAPLLPKLRGHFAEFLDDASPVGLRILSLPTCVGFRTGIRNAIAAFLGGFLSGFATFVRLA